MHYKLVEYRPNRWVKVDVTAGTAVALATPYEVTTWLNGQAAAQGGTVRRTSLESLPAKPPVQERPADHASADSPPETVRHGAARAAEPGPTNAEGEDVGP